jgi:hypothetical protein
MKRNEADAASFREPPAMASDYHAAERLSPETLVALRDFYTALGHDALAAGGVVWFVAGSFSLCSTPTILIPDVKDKDVRTLLRRTKKLAAIYGTTQDEGTIVAKYVLRKKSYDYNDLQRQFRQHVNKAEKVLEARECSWREWEVAAMRCDAETLRRRGMVDPASHPLLSLEGRSRVVSIAARIPDLRIQACFHGDEIVAYLAHLTMGCVCEGLMMHRRDEQMESASRHASHLVYFTFAKAAMARPEIQSVCVGRQSVPTQRSLTSFKRHAGFEELPYPLRFRLHGLVAPVFEHRLSSRILRAIRTTFANKMPALANLEVMERAGMRRKPGPSRQR